MDNAEVFRYLLTNRAFPDNEIKEWEFKFTTVFNKFGPSYCCCRCAFYHEYFSYISDSGDINLEKFDNLVKAIRDGYCHHTTNVNEKRYLKETKVNVFHIAAALGLEDLSQTLLSYLRNGKLKAQYIIRRGLFQLHPYEIAVLKGNEKVLQYAGSWRYAENTPNWWRRLTLADTLIYACGKQKDVLHLEEIPLYEIYVMKRNTPTYKMLFDSSDHPIDLACRKRIYECLFKYKLKHIVENILSYIVAESENGNILRRMFVDVHSIAEYAAIYDVQNIFEKSVQVMSETTETQLLELTSLERPTLLEICEAFQRHTFKGILLNKLSEVPLKTSSSTLFSNFECLYCLLTCNPLSRVPIKNAMAQIPDIGRIINIPFDDNGKDYLLKYQGLTPIQAYMMNYNTVDVSVVRTLIDLGADIDVVFPPNLKVYRRSIDLFSGRNRETTPSGQSLIMYILNEERGFKKNFKKLLEVLLYENVSLGLNKTAVATCLTKYKYQALPCLTGKYNCKCTDTESKRNFVGIGTYFTDATIREIPCYYTLQLLIEAGFEYSCADIDEVLHSVDKKELVELRQHIKQTGKCYHIEKTYPHEVVLECLKRCVSEPRSLNLKLRCRDVLRIHFPKRQIHNFVKNVEMPDRIRDFLLLKPILQTLKDDN